MKDFLSDQQSREMIAELARILPEALEKRSMLLPASPFATDDDDFQRRKWDPVFTGGGIVGLLITDPAAPPPSRTKDIDLVLEIANYAEFAGMEESLRIAGFTQPGWLDNAPIVAWQWKGVRVDFLPHLPLEFMQSNRWFPYLVHEAERVEVTKGNHAWLASAPCFLATKFEAFYSRGKGDYIMSKDIEDILAVIDGRVETLEEILICSHEVRGFVAQSCRRLLTEPGFMDCLPQLVPDDRREHVAAERLKQLGALT